MKTVMKFMLVLLAIVSSFAIGTICGIKFSEERFEQDKDRLEYVTIPRSQNAETISEAPKETEATTETLQDNRDRINEAYVNGWQFWFAGYGYGQTKSISAQYMGKYIYGKRYGKEFESEYEAFTAGFCDGYFQVNGSSPDVSHYKDRIDRGYNEYYGG